MSVPRLKALITVKGQVNDGNYIVDQIFDIKLVSKGKEDFEQICPFDGLDVLTRDFLMGYVNPAIMVLTVLLSLLI